MKPPRSLFRARPHGEPPSYLLEVLEIAKTATPGTVQYVNVAHDDGCEIFAGGACNCNPVVELAGPPPERN